MWAACDVTASDAGVGRAIAVMKQKQQDLNDVGVAYRPIAPSLTDTHHTAPDGRWRLNGCQRCSLARSLAGRLHDRFDDALTRLQRLPPYNGAILENEECMSTSDSDQPSRSRLYHGSCYTSDNLYTSEFR